MFTMTVNNTIYMAMYTVDIYTLPIVHTYYTYIVYHILSCDLRKIRLASDFRLPNYCVRSGVSVDLKFWYIKRNQTESSSV